ncbi:MAG: hypothetical protein M1568_03860 [Acidobacteria bacterium]|nr:hypothetical protein [Acidobacteriota bacterium]
MCADLSTSIPSGRARRIAASLLRACGGTTAYLQVPPLTGDQNDGGQVGLDAPNLQLLPLAPAIFQKMRSYMLEGQQQRHELRVSADAVAAQVAGLQLTSASALFAMASGVVIGGELFMIEGVTTLEDEGEVYLYRLMLRDAASRWPLQNPQTGPQS